jgi:plasmid stabilization system protein ParE
MSFDYLFLETAQKEYEEAIEWYQQRSQSAAENFVLSVQETLELICNNPERWRNEYSNYHELGVKKYPHSLVYIIEPEKQRVIITAVYHGKRNPLKKYFL